MGRHRGIASNYFSHEQVAFNKVRGTRGGGASAGGKTTAASVAHPVFLANCSQDPYLDGELRYYGRVVFGSGDKSTARLVGPGISEEHAEIHVERNKIEVAEGEEITDEQLADPANYTVTIKKLDSSARLLINGAELPQDEDVSKPEQPSTLAIGDILTVGFMKFRVTTDANEQTRKEKRLNAEWHDDTDVEVLGASQAGTNGATVNPAVGAQIPGVISSLLQAKMGSRAKLDALARQVTVAQELVDEANVLLMDVAHAAKPHAHGMYGGAKSEEHENAEERPNNLSAAEEQFDSKTHDDDGKLLQRSPQWFAKRAKLLANVEFKVDVTFHVASASAPATIVISVLDKTKATHSLWRAATAHGRAAARRRAGGASAFQSAINELVTAARGDPSLTGTWTVGKLKARLSQLRDSRTRACMAADGEDDAAANGRVAEAMTMATDAVREVSPIDMRHTLEELQKNQKALEGERKEAESRKKELLALKEQFAALESDIQAAKQAAPDLFVEDSPQKSSGSSAKANGDSSPSLAGRSTSRFKLRTVPPKILSMTSVESMGSEI